MNWISDKKALKIILTTGIAMENHAMGLEGGGCHIFLHT